MNLDGRYGDVVALVALCKAAESAPGVDAWTSLPGDSPPYANLLDAYGEARIWVFEGLYVWAQGCAPCSQPDYAAEVLVTELRSRHPVRHCDVRSGCPLRCLGLEPSICQALWRAGVNDVGALVSVARAGRLRRVRKVGPIGAAEIYGALTRAGFRVPPP
ncbi:hypothetical protein ACQEU3_05385 [Spirillospora sp. CA-253888]